MSITNKFRVNKSSKICRIDIARELSATYEMSYKNAYDIVNTTFDFIREELAMGSVVELRRFGTFYFKERAERQALNIITGERVNVPRHTIIDFRPCNSLKEKIERIKA